MGTSPISLAMFNSYVKLPEGIQLKTMDTQQNAKAVLFNLQNEHMNTM
jgi:hypothetical protein